MEMGNETLEFILKKWDLDLSARSPIELPDTTRVDLARLFGELGFRAGAEIGTADGGYADALYRANKRARLWCVDPYVDYDGYTDFTFLEHLQNHIKALDRFEGIKNVTILPMTSMEALKLFEDGLLDFVYIDGNHELTFVVRDIYYWWKKVRSGGIVAGHDYLFGKREGIHVRQAVEACAEVLGIEMWFVTGEKTKRGKERARSWLMVKP